ncbi:unnamed protein product [Cochlearia groenlandica]
MSIISSKASSLCFLIVFVFLLNSQTTLSLRVPKLQQEEQTLIDGSSSSMSKIEPSKSMVAGFFSHKFPLMGWSFPKYPPFTMVNPNIPTNPSETEEESVKLPSSPSNGNKDGGNA